MLDETPRQRRGVYRQGWDRDGRLLFDYVGHYAEDEEFGRALVRLFAGCVTNEGRAVLLAAREIWQLTPICWREDAYGSWARGYLTEVIDMAEHFGLNRLVVGQPVRLRINPHDLSDERRLGRGHELIHAWCVGRANADSSGYDWPPSSFLSGVGAGGGWPDVGDVVSRQVFEAKGSDGTAVEIVDERREPLVTLTFSDRWDPRSESRADARSRLLARLKGELDAKLKEIESAAREVGYDDRQDEETERDLVWLFMKARHGLSYAEVATKTRSNPLQRHWFARRRRSTSEGLSAASRREGWKIESERDAALVKTAVKRMSDRLGVDRSGW